MNPPDTLAGARDYVQLRRALTEEFKVALIKVLQLDLEPQEIGLDTPLFGSGLGLDSVDALAITATIEQKFRVQVLDTDIGQFRSINSVVDFILLSRETATGTNASTPNKTAAGPAAPAVVAVTYDAEATHPYVRVRDDLGLFDFDATEKVQVEGGGAFEFLDHELAGNLADLAIGDICESVLLDDDGRIHALVWVLRRERSWWVIGQEGLRRGLCGSLAARSVGQDVLLTDVTDEFGMLALVGPRAQEAMLDLFDEELVRMAYCEFIEREYRGAPSLIARFGASGEFDYRMFVPSAAKATIKEFLLTTASTTELEPSLYEFLAMEMKSIRSSSLPAEPCFPTAVDLQWMLHFRKERFRGREGATANLTSTARRAVLLEFDDAAVAGDGAYSAPSGEVRLGGEVKGIVQRVGHSHRLGKGIAFCFLDADYAYPGIRFTLGKDGTIPAISRAAPLFLTRTVVDNINV